MGHRFSHCIRAVPTSGTGGTGWFAHHLLLCHLGSRLTAAPPPRGRLWSGLLGSAARLGLRVAVAVTIAELARHRTTHVGACHVGASATRGGLGAGASLRLWSRLWYGLPAT
eukprot:COSAG01_NODE_6011_length_3902_cov_10.567447_2_plen_112_part_00